MSDIQSLQIRDLIALALMYKAPIWQMDNDAINRLPITCYELADAMMEARKK